MSFYDPVFNSTGGIDSEVDHPEFGRIPITARHDDYDTAKLYLLMEPHAAAYVEPDPVEPEVQVPYVVSRYQARMALLDAGILADAEVAIGGAGVEAQMAWAEASVWERASPTIAAMADALGLTEEQVDALFIQAATYRA